MSGIVISFSIKDGMLESVTESGPDLGGDSELLTDPKDISDAIDRVQNAAAGKR